MADEQPRPGRSPGTEINEIEASVRKDFTSRLESARAQVREARDKADAEKICAQKANEEMTRRMAGVPVTAVAGAPGVLAGALLDESVVTRAVFAVGGTMFMVGATAYALIHPHNQGG